MRSDGRIVVGVDGSVRSVAALYWAVAHAEKVQSSVDVVTAWAPGLGPAAMTLGAGAAPGHIPGALEAEALEAERALEARELARTCVGRAGAERAPVTVRTWAIKGSPGPVLCDLAAPTDLLVVGPSGHGALLGAVLGSVTHHVIRHAPCPVVVVRDDDA